MSATVYIDLDAAGTLVSMTIEHAKRADGLPKVGVEEMLAR